jgi:hypothetical protein
MKPSVIVWDLETVPDLGGFAAANDLVGKSDVEVREAIGDKFPKHIYHSIVCIGALIAHREPDHWSVDAVGELPLGTGAQQMRGRHPHPPQQKNLAFLPVSSSFDSWLCHLRHRASGDGRRSASS